jgi:membrane protein
VTTEVYRPAMAETAPLNARLPWWQRLRAHPRLQPWFARAPEVAQFALRRARELKLAQVAGSLTFTSVLALVPLLAVVAAVFATFPMFADFRVALEKNLIRELLPEAYAGTLLRNLNSFAAKAGQLTALGLAGLLVTSMMMIATVDQVLNEMWYVRRHRPLLQRVLVYWALVTIGPVLVGASLATTSYLLSMTAGVARQLPALLRAALDYLPVVISTLGYAALYVVVPNTRVRWRDALIGGFLAATAGEIVKEGFASYIRTGSVASIYGAFAVVPLFLTWVYLAWLVVLLGASVTAALPALRGTRFTDLDRAGDDFFTAAALLRRLYRARGGPQAEQSTETLAQATRTALSTVEKLLQVLEQLGYVRPLAGESAGRWRFIGNDEQLTLRPLFERLVLDPADTLALPNDAEGWVGARALDRIDLPLKALG